MERKRKSAFHVPLRLGENFFRSATLSFLFTPSASLFIHLSLSLSLSLSPHISLLNSHICCRDERGDACDGDQDDDDRRKIWNEALKEGRPIVQSGSARKFHVIHGFLSISNCNPVGSPCSAKEKGNLYGYGGGTVPNPRLFCLSTFSFIRLHAVSVSVGEVKGYRAAISEMETWHFFSAHSLSCQIFHA